MTILDKAMEDDLAKLKGRKWSFTNFKTEIVHWAPQQPNSFDCGVFVMKWMDRSCSLTEMLDGHVRFIYYYFFQPPNCNNFSCLAFFTLNFAFNCGSSSLMTRGHDY